MSSPSRNVSSLLTITASQYPGRTAIVSGAERMTYAQLDAASNQVANLLVERGIRPGDKVALSCPNTPHLESDTEDRPQSAWYLNEILNFVLKTTSSPARSRSSSTTSATRRSRRVSFAVFTACTAASSHDEELVPTISMIL